jgi:bifunctional N-acetylglucosamine-1-phosphate-uridyltransferase/glucosamine-1-phosphate-acetyltransferase GlmU-like protein
MPAPVGTAVAVIAAEPRMDGLQEHVTVMFGEVPLVNLLIHPGIRKFLTLKVTRAGTETAAVMVRALP